MDDDQLPLQSFRQQWHQELAGQATNQHRRESQPTVDDVQQQLENVNLSPTPSSREDQARSLFEQAAELERQGRVFDAIPLYKKAVHLVTDIEYKIHEWSKQQMKENPPKDQSKSTKEIDTKVTASESEELADNLTQRFLDSIQIDGRYCHSATAPGTISIASSAHISELPVEVFLLISRWIVSNDLDIQSLERCALVCRGFYLLARDPELWRLICLKVWGVQLGTLPGSGFTSWREMFFERTRLRFNGCYISKTEYFRLGENSFQDTSYKPVHHVEYYRYLRFFPDGVCLMMTSSDEPTVGVRKLRYRQTTKRDIMRGFYRLNQDQVTILLQRKMQVDVPTIAEKRSKVTGLYLSCEQTFHAELQVQSSNKRRRFNQLHWERYRIIQTRDGKESSSEFHLTPAKYPVFYFSRVEHYSQETNSMLAL